MYITSDGGVYNYEDTYRVIISDGESPIASNKGKLYSIDFQASPFRSEMFSMLVGIRSLLHITKEYNRDNTLSGRIHIYSDNRRLIKKMIRRRQMKRTVNQHRDSDVDLELQLLNDVNILEEYNCSVSIDHVKSHQESLKTKNELSHEEAMNILADKLCKEARLHKKLTTYEFPPISPISLVINKEIINSKYSYRSKMAYHSIPLRQHYKDKNYWTDATINNVINL